MASDTAGRLCQIRPAHAQTRPPTRKARVGCWGAGELDSRTGLFLISAQLAIDPLGPWARQRATQLPLLP